MINSYDFGNIVIDEKSFHSDVIVYPDRIDSGWWRKEGHQLNPEDIGDVVQAKPEVLVIGTGKYGNMIIQKQTKDLLVSTGINLIAARTDKAWKIFNEVSQQKKAVGAFHLTC